MYQVTWTIKEASNGYILEQEYLNAPTPVRITFVFKTMAELILYITEYLKERTVETIENPKEED